MSLLEIVILCIVVFLCLYTIVDRICKCFEQCCITKAFKKYTESAEMKDEMKEE